HSSLPQQGVDTITIAASIITALNTIVAKNIDPMDNSTLNIGVINGGVAPNIIADKTELICMTRNMTSDARDTMLEKIKTISTGIATAMGGECEVNVRVGYSSVYNDEFLSEFVTKTILQKEKEIFEDIPNVPANYLITKDTAVLGAEDFGFYSQKAPSCLLWMGVGKSAPLHNPEFTVNETYIKVCTRTMALLTAEYLK
ncbi:MAG: peptidase dimerization domain-containing protein, partial [Oscillospiraceae bacterium]